MEQVFDIKTAATISKTMEQIMDRSNVKLHEYKGVPFNSCVKEDTLANVMPNWKAREDDVFIVTYPKAGTTWAQEIMYLAIHGGDVDKAKKTHAIFRVPYLEFTTPTPLEQKVKWFAHPFKSLIVLWCALKIFLFLLLCSIRQGRFSIPTQFDLIEMMPSPRLIKSHLPEHLLPPDIYSKKAKIICVMRNPKDLAGRFSIPTQFDLIDMMSSPRLIKSHLPEHLLPPDIYSKKAKIICVMRNPKDLAVSLYHFCQWVPDIPTPHSWDAFFNDFMKGNVIYGKWYEHYLGFWKRRHDENILILKYEDMKKDEKAAVTLICEFLGYQYSDDIINRIVQHTTFGSMKANVMSNPDLIIPKMKDVHFMRKGVVGDWKNYFSDAQDQAIMAVYQDKFTGTGLTFEFE